MPAAAAQALRKAEGARPQLRRRATPQIRSAHRQDGWFSHRHGACLSQHGPPRLYRRQAGDAPHRPAAQAGRAQRSTLAGGAADAAAAAAKRQAAAATRHHLRPAEGGERARGGRAQLWRAQLWRARAECGAAGQRRRGAFELPQHLLRRGQEGRRGARRAWRRRPRPRQRSARCARIRRS